MKNYATAGRIWEASMNGILAQKVSYWTAGDIALLVFIAAVVSFRWNAFVAGAGERRWREGPRRLGNEADLCSDKVLV